MVKERCNFYSLQRKRFESGRAGFLHGEKKKNMIKINPDNSVISFSFPAMQISSHNSVSDTMSRLLRWFKKKVKQNTTLAF